MHFPSQHPSLSQNEARLEVVIDRHQSLVEYVKKTVYIYYVFILVAYVFQPDHGRREATLLSQHGGNLKEGLCPRVCTNQDGCQARGLSRT